MRLLVHKNCDGSWYVRMISRVGGRVAGVPYAGPFGTWPDAYACADRMANRWRKPPVTQRTTLTCNRCGAARGVTGTATAHLGWGTLAIPGLLSRRIGTLDLCPRCTDDVHRFISIRPTVPEETQ